MTMASEAADAVSIAPASRNGSSIVSQDSGRSARWRSIFLCISSSSRRCAVGDEGHPGVGCGELLGVAALAAAHAAQDQGDGGCLLHVTLPYLRTRGRVGAGNEG